MANDPLVNVTDPIEMTEKKKMLNCYISQEGMLFPKRIIDAGEEIFLSYNFGK